MTCTTHHNACDCREAALQERIASLQAENTHWCSVANQRAIDLASERQRVRGLEAALRELIIAVTFADPPKDYGTPNEPNLCHEARVPTAFIDTARKALGEG